jgi:integrase
MYRLAEWADIEGTQVAAHSLRRTFAVMYMRQEDADGFKLRELMGHSVTKSTLIYARDFSRTMHGEK